MRIMCARECLYLRDGSPLVICVFVRIMLGRKELEREGGILLRLSRTRPGFCATVSECTVRPISDR